MNSIETLFCGYYMATPNQIMVIGQYSKNFNHTVKITGIMRVVSGLVSHLQKKENMEVEVATENLKSNKSFVYRAFKFVYTLIKSKAKVFHIHGVDYPVVVALFISKLRRKKTVYTAHGLISREKSLGYKYPVLYSFCEYCLIQFSDIITTVSKNMKQMIIEDYHIDNLKIIIIENGVDTSFFSTMQSPLFLDYKKSNHNILFIGGTRKVKGLNFLFKTINLLIKKDVNITLFVVGKKGDQHTTLLSRYTRLFEEGIIKFLGQISEKELLTLYELSDIFILPSLYEPFGLVVLEAMAKGKPVIVSDRVGASSMITNMKDGIIVTYGDIDSMVSAIELLFKNQEKRMEIEINAKETAKEYTWEKIVEKYIKCYACM